ncbi:MAG: hypothetical protein AAFQ45_15220 [Pseudomonadota bacterium]
MGFHDAAWCGGQLAVATVGFAVAVSGGLRAQTASEPVPAPAPGICVVCNEPPAIYECVLPADVPASIAQKGLVQKGMRFTCLSRIAKEKGHARCGVRRGVQGACTGDIYTLSLAPRPPRTEPEPGTVPKAGSTNAGDPQAAAPQIDKTPAQPSATEPAAKPDADTPPKTVQEAAERAVEKSGDQLGKTGKAIGDAAEKSWKCVTSLFQDC